MKYIASWNVDGWYNSANYESTNKNQLLKDIREICKGEWGKGKTGHFCVDDETGRPVFDGFISQSGRVFYAVKNYKRIY